MGVIMLTGVVLTITTFSFMKLRLLEEARIAMIVVAVTLIPSAMLTLAEINAEELS